MREPGGAYLKEDWTGIADIGRAFAGGILTEASYRNTENAYVQSLIGLLDKAGVASMSVSDIERRETAGLQTLGDGTLSACLDIIDDLQVAGQQLEYVIRGCLREYLWCRLLGPRDSYVHFGYDFYTYIGLPEPADAHSVAQGLYLEECKSPYEVLDE
jgi:hypothetical protein